jgi:hypothetical protein
MHEVYIDLLNIQFFFSNAQENCASLYRQNFYTHNMKDWEM